MAIFAAVISGSQSSSGLVLTFLDESDYSTNTEGYVIADFTTRNILIYDSSDTLLETIVLGSDTSATYDVTEDQRIRAVLVLDGIGSYTDTVDLSLNRITRNLYRTTLAEVGCCGNKTKENALMFADLFMTGADIEATSTDGAAFDEDISSAYTYLNSVN